jgi:hypothetical protein
MDWEQNVNPDTKWKRLKEYNDVNQRVFDWFQCARTEHIPPPQNTQRSVVFVEECHCTAKPIPSSEPISQ